MKKLVIIAVALLVAGAAGALTAASAGTAPGGGDNAAPAAPNPALGSVLSSFFIKHSSSPWPCGIGRDGTYVYVFFGGAGDYYFRRYTTTGRSLGSVRLQASYYGAAGCHLGASYLTVVRSRAVHFMYIPTGSMVGSFAVSDSLEEVAFNGTYYFVAGQSSGPLLVYTTGGSLVGSWGNFGTGGLDWNLHVNGANNGGTGYMLFFAGYSRNSAVSYPQGSVVGSWRHMSVEGLGAMCGRSSTPATMGAVAWTLMYNGTAHDYYCYQVDLGNYNVGVVPASIGKVKALFR
jgi:hypothetical protein